MSSRLNSIQHQILSPVSSYHRWSDAFCCQTTQAKTSKINFIFMLSLSLTTRCSIAFRTNSNWSTPQSIWLTTAQQPTPPAFNLSLKHNLKNIAPDYNSWLKHHGCEVDAVAVAPWMTTVIWKQTWQQQINGWTKYRETMWHERAPIAINSTLVIFRLSKHTRRDTIQNGSTLFIVYVFIWRNFSGVTQSICYLSSFSSCK